MDTIEFAREIERASRRIVELRRAASGEASSAWVEAALAELSAAIEELKVAEEELTSRSEQLAEARAQAQFERVRHRELFMAAPFGQLVTDLKGIIIEGNRAAGDLLGIPPADLAGKPLPLMVSQADRGRFSHWIAVLKDAAHDASVCADCGGSGEFEIAAASRGRVLPCEVTAAPMADRLGRIESIQWCLWDVTDRHQAQAARRLALDREVPRASGGSAPRTIGEKRMIENGGHRILIVDDNADAAELLAEKLRRAGYQVDLAFDGRSGLAVARERRCQVALVDLGLPDLDGFDVCRALKEGQPEVRVVALTGYSDSTSRERASQVGFERFLVKPLDPRQVAAAVAELLDPNLS